MRAPSYVPLRGRLLASIGPVSTCTATRATLRSIASAPATRTTLRAIYGTYCLYNTWPCLNSFLAPSEFTLSRIRRKKAKCGAVCPVSCVWFLRIHFPGTVIPDPKQPNVRPSSSADAMRDGYLGNPPSLGSVRCDSGNRCRFPRFVEVAHALQTKPLPK